MPTYDYQCPDCGHTFEAFHGINAAPVKKCPECGKRKVKRLIGTGAGLIFKGSGFYQTDYVRKPDSGGKTESKPQGPSESSPAAGT